MIRTRLLWMLMGLVAMGAGCEKKGGDNSGADGKTQSTQDPDSDKTPLRPSEEKSKRPNPDVQGTGDN
jgi:hypothetical protein